LVVALFVGASMLAVACTPAPIVVTKKKPPASAADDDSADSDSSDAEEEGPGGDAPPNRPGSGEDPDAFTPIDTSTIDPLFATEMQRAKITGTSVAVVRDGKLKWAKGYGFANVAAQKAVTKDTLFMLASVSKTVTGVALMQLIEDPSRGVTLDADVSTKAGFTVRHPRFPNVPITYRMLLTHTSSFVDGDGYNQEPSPRPTGDSSVTLQSYVQSASTNQSNWLLNDRPGTTYQYSNTAIALAGMLVEKIAGENLNQYSKKKIFEPLQMSESSWFIKDLDPSHVATPYEGTSQEAQGHYGYPDYPAGQLRTSAPQLARFLMMFAGGGQYKTTRVLKAETVTEMKRAQFPSVEPSQGLVWYSDTRGTNTAVMGHTGGDVGVSTEMFFDPKTSAGYVLLMSSNRTTSDVTFNSAVTKLSSRLLDLARTLP